MEKTPQPLPETNEHLFFDPKPPPIPEQVFGFDSEQVLKLAKNAGLLALYTPYSKATYPVTKYGYRVQQLAEDAVRVAPLVERVHAGEQLRPQDVRPYRKSIKSLIRRSDTVQGRRFGKVDRLFAALSIVGIGIPLRRRLNKRVEEEFVARAPQMLEDALGYAREHIDVIEPYVETIASYDNPQAEVRNEIYAINHVVKEGAHQSAKRRGTHNPTSVDVARAIHNEINYATQHPEKWEKHLPLFAKMFPFRRAKKTPRISDEVLGVAAPEIVESLDLLSPKDKRDPEFVKRILHNPHPKRGLAYQFKRRQMETLERVTLKFIPNLIDMIPESGQEIRSIFGRIKKIISH